MATRLELLELELLELRSEMFVLCSEVGGGLLELKV